MSEKGQNNYKGVNAQAWAAMSLFLQYLQYKEFSYIQLEAPKFEDFNLVFNDGHNIICESKDWKREFSFSHLRLILDNILRKTLIGEKDEILIICTKLDKNLKSKVENMKYWSQLVEPEFRKKKFSVQQIAILNKVKFWEVKAEDNYLLVYSLFNELLDFWLPEDELECKVNSILVDRIYKGSEKGDIYKREDIINEIELIREKAIKNSGYFDNERVNTEKQLKNLISAVNNKSAPQWANSQLSAISAKPSLMFFILDLLSYKKINSLRDWDYLWSLCYRTSRFSFSLFRIFEKNLHTKDNKKYILQFFTDNVGKIRNFYQYDFVDVNISKITKMILKSSKGDEFVEDAFKVVRKLITGRLDNIFYFKEQQDKSWQRSEVAKLLKDIYEKAKPELRGKIYELITETFNLVEDDDEYNCYTPKEIFEILRIWLEDNFESRVLIFTRILSEQYDRFYRKFSKKLKFNGWEHMGSVNISWGYDYKVSDRSFITFTLKPALEKYYKESKDKEVAWDFVKNNCIIFTENVSKNKPDFLNRAALPIILHRYKDNNKKISDEAFEILKEFILSRMGIPHKSDLIYQEICNDFSDDKKWKLVKISLDKYKLPINPFVEKIVLELAKEGNEETKTIIKSWLENPGYYKRDRLSRKYIVVIISEFLDFSFNEGLEMFKDFIKHRNFVEEFDVYSPFDIADLLNKIIYINFESGLGILEELSRKQKLSNNEQILLCNSLTRRDDSKNEDIEILSKIYNKFLDPFLNSLNNDIKKIESKITNSQPRESIVEYAGVLAENKKISEAMRIVRIFINDSNPCTPEKIDSEDSEGKYDEHKSIERGEDTSIITTVRGRCTWVLMKCLVLEGRDYIEEIIELTEKLAHNKNYYIQLMSSYPLYQLAKDRLTIMPDNKEVLFFNDNKEKALRMAKRVEGIAFKLLDNFLKLEKKPRDVLLNSLIKVFNYIRALNQNDAMKLIEGIAKCSDEVIGEASPLFIYFAEFRQKDFKNWKWQLPGLYDDLENFNNNHFN